MVGILIFVQNQKGGANFDMDEISKSAIHPSPAGKKIMYSPLFKFMFADLLKPKN